MTESAIDPNTGQHPVPATGPRLPPPQLIRADVRRALREDLGCGDLTARLIPPERQFSARVVLREKAVVCGRAWFDECFRQLSSDILIQWFADDGQTCEADHVVCRVSGPARAILSGERSALNFLQLLSGVATRANALAARTKHSPTRILDTRKTIPGLRLAQKYAVRCGGCHNHRIGLYDAVLIKENHIAAAGTITLAVHSALQFAAGRMVEVEAESLEQAQEALQAGAQRVMLDNFSVEQVNQAVQLLGGKIQLEVSGGITEQTLDEYIATGVDFISIGSLTKDLKATDYSMRFEADAGG